MQPDSAGWHWPFTRPKRKLFFHVSSFISLLAEERRVWKIHKKKNARQHNKQMCTYGPKEEQHRDSNAHDYLEYFYDLSHSRPWNIDETAHRCSRQRVASYLRRSLHHQSPEYQWRSISILRLFLQCPTSFSRFLLSSHNVLRQVWHFDSYKDQRERDCWWASIFLSPIHQRPSVWIQSHVSQIFYESDRAVMRIQCNHVRDLQKKTKHKQKREENITKRMHCWWGGARGEQEDNNSRTNWKYVQLFGMRKIVHNIRWYVRVSIMR